MRITRWPGCPAQPRPPWGAFFSLYLNSSELPRAIMLLSVYDRASQHFHASPGARHMGGALGSHLLVQTPGSLAHWMEERSHQGHHMTSPTPKRPGSPPHHTGGARGVPVTREPTIHTRAQEAEGWQEGRRRARVRGNSAEGGLTPTPHAPAQPISSTVGLPGGLWWSPSWVCLGSSVCCLTPARSCTSFSSDTKTPHTSALPLGSRLWPGQESAHHSGNVGPQGLRLPGQGGLPGLRGTHEAQEWVD